MSVQNGSRIRISVRNLIRLISILFTLSALAIAVAATSTAPFPAEEFKVTSLFKTTAPV